MEAPFGPTTPTNLSNNGMCPHLGYNYSSTAFGGPNIALTYYAESMDGVAWVKVRVSRAAKAGARATACAKPLASQHGMLSAGLHT